VLNDYRAETGDKTISVVVSTASPFKFCDSVLEALGQPQKGSGAQLLDLLSKETGYDVPVPLASLKGKSPRFSGTVPIENMKGEVLKFLRG